MSSVDRVASYTNPTSLAAPPTGDVRSQTLNMVANDNVTPIFFDNPPQLQLTGRLSWSKLPENGIPFKHFWPNGKLTTKECLFEFRTTAPEPVRNNLGFALTIDDHGDPITMVTKRTTPMKWNEMKWNMPLTKGCVKDIISPMGCNIHVRKGGGCVEGL